MQCIRPISGGYDLDGNITFKPKKANPELVGFKFPCRKCLACRLNIGREKAIRAYHEAKCHDSNIFLTLTYADEHLTSPRLVYGDFQAFMKALRKRTPKKLGFMVTGEYGEQTKRPHWHAIIFNWEPSDPEKHYVTQRGDQVWKSETLTNLWKKGHAEYGSVTLDSAGYIARYAAKKLIHGNDQEHDFHPVHRTSCVNAMGKTWIEKHYRHTFNNGFVVLPNGEKAGIPRYYEDWLRKHHFDDYVRYLSTVKEEQTKKAQEREAALNNEFLRDLQEWKGQRHYPLKKADVSMTILKQKFKKLQEKLKL